MVITTTGKKIKRYREILKITQRELADKVMSPSFLSAIENDRRRLSAIKAAYLADKLMKISVLKNNPIQVSAREFLIDEIIEIKELCIEKLNKILDFPIEEAMRNLKEIEKIARKYEFTTILGEIQITYGKVYFQNCNYSEACISFEKAIEMNISISTTELIELYNSMGRCKVMMKEYTVACEFLNEGVELYRKSNLIDERLLRKLYFNLSLALNGSADYEKALDYLGLYKDLISPNNTEEQLSLVIQQGNIYCRLDQYERAISSYFRAIELLKYYEDKTIAYTVYNNIAIVYERLGNESLAIGNLQKALELQLKLKDTPNAHKTLLQLGEIAFRYGRNEEAIGYLRNASQNSYNYKDYYKLIEAMEKLISLYLSFNNINKARDALYELISKCERDEVIDKYKYLYINAAKFEMKYGNKEMVEHFLDKL